MNISENSRVWIYQSSRFFTAEEEHIIQQQLNDFIAKWQAHGHQLAAKAEIRYHLFIISSIDEQQASSTGCSIDKSVHLMKEFEHQLGINLFDRFQIAYRNAEGNIKLCNQNQFVKLLNSGVVSNDTIVFNNLVATQKALQTDWEVPLIRSWHAQVFSV